MNRGVRIALWLIYAALLAVMLPHTAWAFAQFEPAGFWGRLLGWVAAVAFEGAIAALTWRLKERLESVPNYTAGAVWLRKFKYRYVNAYAIGLFVAAIISVLANWSHAVEFGRSFAVFDQYGVPSVLFSVAFGGILTVVSFLFAHVLADETEAEAEESEALTKAKSTITELRSTVRKTERELRNAEQRAKEAEARFAAAGDLFARLMAESKRERILAAVERWPQLPASSVAIITEASPSYVSEVVNQEVERA